MPSMLFGQNPQSARGRHVRSRVQVFFEVDPSALSAKLPEGVRPRRWRGCVLGELRFTRLNAGGTLLGPVVGGLVYGVAKYYLAIILPGFQLLIFAPIIILIIVLFPEGIVGMLKTKLKGTALGAYVL